MPAITASNCSGSGAKAVTTTTLNGTDSFTYVAGSILIFNNPTGSPITPVIDGDGASTVSVAGVGSVDISGGYDCGSIAAGASKAIALDTIKSYLAGTIAINSGSGLEAQLLTF